MTDSGFLYEVSGRKIAANPDTLEAVRGDAQSNLLTFKVPRMFDGVDLSTKTAAIRYQNAAGTTSRSYGLNKQADEAYVTFGWLLSSNVAAQDGTVKYQLEFSDGGGYVWQTTLSSLTVAPGLADEVQPENPENPNWIQEVFAEIDAKVVGAAEAAQNAASAAATDRQAAEQAAGIAASSAQEAAAKSSKAAESASAAEESASTAAASAAAAAESERQAKASEEAATASAAASKLDAQATAADREAVAADKNAAAADRAAAETAAEAAEAAAARAEAAARIQLAIDDADGGLNILVKEE